MYGDHLLTFGEPDFIKSELGKRTRLINLGTAGGESLLVRDVRADSGGAGASAAAGPGGSGSAAPPLLVIDLPELAGAHAALAELFA